MNKIILASLLILLCLPVQALDFFGIEYNGNSADNIINMLYSLIQNDVEQAEIAHTQLEATDPNLAKDVVIEDLKIPCFFCKGTGVLDAGTPCEHCEGTGWVADADALTYLQNKFSTAVDAGQSETSAWKKAKAAFDERRELVLSRQAVFGTILRREKGGLLLSRQLTNEVVYVTDLNLSFSRAGMPINGTVWPNGTYAYTNDVGEQVEVPSYTATLWMD